MSYLSKLWRGREEQKKKKKKRTFLLDINLK